MSYAVDVPPDVMPQLLACDIDVQEVILDEIDSLADAAEALPPRPVPLSYTHEKQWTNAGGTHGVYLWVIYDPLQRIIQIGEISYRCHRAI